MNAMKLPLMTSIGGPRVRHFTAAGLAAFTCVAMAQVPGPSLAVPGAGAPNADLGPLILSPAQRRNLEAARKLEASPDGGPHVVLGDKNPDAATGLPDTLVVSGFVTRSGNRSTVWINDQALYGQASITPLRTLAGQAGALQPGGADLRIKARPGQVIDVPSGQAVDLLPPGAIRIIPPKTGQTSSNKE
ncbi:MAG: hypothetical protein ACT6Q9_17240 [Polaromonas sp.]|uniref:hypothetical protein n=1 Tax=Polaromonas sp. TaxID=1869339 RepID=UPI004035A1C2